ILIVVVGIVRESPAPAQASPRPGTFFVVALPGIRLVPDIAPWPPPTAKCIGWVASSGLDLGKAPAFQSLCDFETFSGPAVVGAPATRTDYARTRQKRACVSSVAFSLLVERLRWISFCLLDAER